MPLNYVRLIQFDSIKPVHCHVMVFDYNSSSQIQQGIVIDKFIKSMDLIDIHAVYPLNEKTSL